MEVNSWLTSKSYSQILIINHRSFCFAQNQQISKYACGKPEIKATETDASLIERYL